METIKNLLFPNEQILWENISKLKVGYKYRFSVIFCSILFFNGFFLIVFNKPILLEFLVFPFLLAFNLIFFIIFIVELYSTLRDKKKGKLKWRDLKKYKTIAILTDKRWIQKDLRVMYIKDEENGIERIQHYKDVVIVKLEFIKFIQITEFKELGKWKYNISLYLSYDKKKQKNNYLGLNFSSKIQFQTLFENLQHLIKTKNEEIEKIRTNMKIYRLYY